jgi:Arylsulfotransferase (ASST)
LQKFFSAACFYLVSLLAAVFISASMTLQIDSGTSRLPLQYQRLWQHLITLPTATVSLLRMIQGRSYLVSTSSIPHHDKWHFIFPAPTDSGFLLLPIYDKMRDNVVVRLIRINDGVIVLTWSPKRQSIPARASFFSNWVVGDRLNITHPLLLPGGDIITHVSQGLGRYAPCSSSPTWFLDKSTHHSIEFLEDGNIVTSSLVPPTGIASDIATNHVIDNSVLIVSQDGVVKSETAFTKILSNNNLLQLIYERSGTQVNADPIHLNQMTEAKNDSAFWQKGDLLISSRHLSSLFLFRPSTGKIIWHRDGLWLNQHSAQFLDDHRLALLDNNMASGGPLSGPLSAHDLNKIEIFDFVTNTVEEPYAELLKPDGIATPTQGRLRLLDDGIFVEETDYGRILRYRDNKLLWSYYSEFDDKNIISLGWSRYYTRNEIAKLFEKSPVNPFDPHPQKCSNGQ